MKPISVPSSPKPVVSPPSDQAAATRQGRAQAQFGGVRNAAESGHAARAESPKRSHGVFHAVRSALSHIGGAKSHAAPQSHASSQGVKLDQLVKLDQRAERQHVHNLFSNLASISDRLMPVLQKSSLSGDESRAALTDIARVGHGLQTLVRPFVEGGDGQPRRLLGLSDQAVARLEALTQSKIVGGHSVDALASTAQRQGALAGQRLVLPTVRQFLADTQRALLDLARSTGDGQLVEQAGKLFQAQSAAPAKQAAQTPRTVAAQPTVDPRSYPRPDTSWGGARYRDTPLNKDTATQLSNGDMYYAHAMQTDDGIAFGSATAYPMARDMPDFCRMVQDKGIRDILVLASRDEILTSAGKSGAGHLPYYFGQSHAWGEGDNRHVIDVTRGDSRTHGELTVRDHLLTITGPDGLRTQVTVHHVENWPDRQTVPEEDAIAVAFDLFKQIEARGGSFDELLAHCKAGLGRTGLMLGILRLIQDPDISAQDLQAVMRQIRGPGMVQTAEQENTLDAAQRFLHHMAHSGDTMEQLRPDWPRQSFLVPDTPADGDPIYMNMLSAEPVYANTTPPPLPPKRGAPSTGAHGDDGRPAPPPRPQPRTVPR